MSNTSVEKTLKDENDMQLAIEIFSLLHFCPSALLVDAVKLGLFFEELLEMHSMRTVVMAIMIAIKPEAVSTNESIRLLYEFFNKLDDEYDFQLGPTLLSLSSASQLEQMLKLDLPYLKEHKQMIRKCLDGQDCAELDDVLQNPGFFTFHSLYMAIQFQATDHH